MMLMPKLTRENNKHRKSKRDNRAAKEYKKKNRKIAEFANNEIIIVHNTIYTLNKLQIIKRVFILTSFIQQLKSTGTVSIIQHEPQIFKLSIHTKPK